MGRTRIAVLFALMLGAAVASIGKAAALPPLPPNPGQWNDYCHQDGAEGQDAIEACCTAFASQCVAGCGKDDSTCKSKCSAVRGECIEIGVVTKGGKTQAKPVTPGKPTEAK